MADADKTAETVAANAAVATVKVAYVDQARCRAQRQGIDSSLLAKSIGFIRRSWSLTPWLALLSPVWSFQLRRGAKNRLALVIVSAQKCKFSRRASQPASQPGPWPSAGRCCLVPEEAGCSNAQEPRSLEVYALLFTANADLDPKEED